jgi:VWFA-related protein
VRDRFAAAVAVAALACGPVLLAAPPRTVTLQRVDVTHLPVVDVYLTVTDGSGTAVLGLNEREVSVAIDKTPQKLTSLISALDGGEYLAVALLFDRSGSMRAAMDATRDAAVQFIGRLSVRDELAVVSFDDTVRVDAGFTNDRAALTSAVRSISSGKNTALYDAIQTALDLLEGVRTRRQAIVVLSDGKNTKSVHAAAAVLSAAHARGVAVYTVGLGPELDRAALARIAAETGGLSMNAARADELRVLYQKIADLLNNQYVLSFTSTFGGDESWHTLRVDVAGADVPAAGADRSFIASPGLGVSRELVSSYERRADEVGFARQAAIWGGLGLAAGLLIVLLARVLRPDVSFVSPLAIGIVFVASALGAILGTIARALGR